MTLVVRDAQEAAHGRYTEEQLKVKLDPHTHIWEASGFEPPNVEWAEKVVRQAKAMEEWDKLP